LMKVDAGAKRGQELTPNSLKSCHKAGSITDVKLTAVLFRPLNH